MDLGFWVWIDDEIHVKMVNVEINVVSYYFVVWLLSNIQIRKILHLHYIKCWETFFNMKFLCWYFWSPCALLLCSVSVFGVSAESMQCTYDARGNSVPTILLLMQERLYAQGGLKVYIRVRVYWLGGLGHCSMDRKGQVLVGSPFSSFS